MQITDDVYFYNGREQEKIIRGAGSCNVVVLKTDRQVMVDSGLIVGGSFRDLQTAAAEDGLDLSRTRAVLHTHSHWDHIIGDCFVQKEYGAEVYAHPWARSSIESQKAAFQAFVLDTGDFYGEIIGSPALFIRILLWYVGGSYSGLRLDKTLEGGEELDFGLTVISCHTPGHTPGHIGYYIPQKKVFVGGDLIDLETGEGADLNNPHSNYADGLASLEKVREMNIEFFLPAHGEPVPGKDKVESLLDRISENTHGYIKDVKGILSQGEGTLTEIFTKLMPGTPFTLKAMKMMQILIVLKHLQERGEVALRKKDGKQVWSLNE
jgi:glyoxylase-like metal-dependent hydrolase (beta-lactamase superfamily II)